MSFLVFFLVGIPAGIIGGLLGTGGCVLMMPVIRFGFYFDPAVAVGTTLAAVVCTAGFRGLPAHENGQRRQGNLSTSASQFRAGDRAGVQRLFQQNGALSLLLSIGTIPTTMFLLAGTFVRLDAVAILKGTLLVILLPLVAGDLPRRAILALCG